jgi:hypothetical protein
MEPRSERDTDDPDEQPQPARKSVRILAKSLYRAMRKQGYSPADAVALATDLLELIQEEFAAEKLRRC